MKTLTINCESLSPVHQQKLVDAITDCLYEEACRIRADLSDWPEESKDSSAYKEMKTWQIAADEQHHEVRCQYNKEVYK